LNNRRWILLAVLFFSACVVQQPQVDPTLAVIRESLSEPRPALVKLDLADGLSLEEALELARHHNPALSVVRRQIALAQAGLIEANEYPHNPELFSEGDVNVAGERGSNFRFGISQEFELVGQRDLRAAVAEAEMDRAEVSVSERKRLLVASVSREFYRNVMLDRRVALVAKSLEIARKLRAGAQARFDAKQIPEVDLNLVRLQYQRALGQHAVSQSAVRASRLRLAALIGRPELREIQISGGLETAPVALSLEQARQLAQDNRVDLKGLSLEIEVSRRQLQLEQALGQPNPELGVYYEREDEQGASASNALGLELRLPLPLFNKRRGPIARARARRSVREAKLRGLEQQIDGEIRLAFNRLQRAGQSVQLYQKQLNRLSRKNLEQFQRAYRLGEVGTLKVLRAQEDFNRIALGYLQALLENRLARIALETAVGGGLSR